ncbi:uncharacterized protein LOC124380736 isoform X2 [Silurus meridionalis]|uniref:Ig-like domain-containing protein n=1 Tax=Silurus meridionalis TaxID=175797 RepID=A0A8T0A7S6_SILME|nr:uncharacterized protein LOC124380736 isoform X2 [Silurus meridionalis]KAF7687754.1 hypothetical protein HF521_014982 [Silurus meridionalis]
MKSFSIHHCVLLLLTLIFTTNALDLTSVTVKLNESAVLPCKWNCSGLSKWTMIDTQGIVAWCNETCWSDAGFLISHDQYLKGDLSLTVTAANYIKRGWYNCQCNETEICSVRLSIDTLVSSLLLKTHALLVLDLSILDSVDVIYRSHNSKDLYGENICNVTKSLLQCKAEYTHRVLQRGIFLILNNITVSDSGFYLIKDRRYNEIIHIYTLQVEEIPEVVNVSVNFDDSVTFSCKYKCSLTAEWIYKNDITVAQCNQTSCWSKNTYVMPHDEYLKGNLSLMITAADYSKRGLYRCHCGNTILCPRHLTIRPIRTAVQLRFGEYLLMNLSIPENVEVMYNQSVIYDTTSKQICTLKKGSLECDDKYTQRIERVLRLQVNSNDSGLYTIRDMENNEVIHVYNVSVAEVHPHPCNKYGLCFSPGHVITTCVGLLLSFSLLL